MDPLPLLHFYELRTTGVVFFYTFKSVGECDDCDPWRCFRIDEWN